MSGPSPDRADHRGGRDALQQQRRALGRRRQRQEGRRPRPWRQRPVGRRQARRQGAARAGSRRCPTSTRSSARARSSCKILMGGGRQRRRPAAARRAGRRFGIGRRGLAIVGAALVGLWLLMSFYTVRPEEQSVELTFGECRGDCIGEPGLNFAPWPIVTHEIVQVTRENTEEIGSGTIRGATRRPDADRRREHRRHHLPGGLERARPHASSCSTSPTRPRPSRRSPNWRCARWSRARSCRRSSAATAA